MQSIKVVRAKLSQIDDAKKIREEVFQKEKCIAANIDFDGNDDSALHFIAYAEKPIGTARVRFPHIQTQAKIERLAILPEYRGKGVGAKIIRFIEHELITQNIDEIVLESIEAVKGFYSKLGYEIIGDTFEQAGIPHIKMIKPLRHEGQKKKSV